MDTKQIREMTDDEIEEELQRTRQELFRLNFRAAYQELDNPALLGSLRRTAARLKTIQRERELAQAEERA